MRTLAEGKHREEIWRRVDSLDAGDIALWGRMSVGEVVYHLRESFRMATGERPVAEVRQPVPRWLIKWVALRSPMNWPKGLPTVPELQVRGAGIKAETFASDGFTADKERLRRVMKVFLERAGDARSHPFFGRMSVADWMLWGYLHTDHHLRQFGR